MAEGLFILEGPQPLREGEVRTFAIQWPDFTTVSSGETLLYKDGTLSTSLLSGSEATSGNIQTCRTLTVSTGLGGTTLVLEAFVDVSGQTYGVGIVCPILRPGQEG